MLRTTTPRNRWKIFPSVAYTHVITFCSVWQHHDVLQTSATASKRLRIWPEGCILLQHFETTCVRNVLIVKYPEQQTCTGWLGVIQLVLCYCSIIYCSNLPPRNVYQLQASGVWILSILTMQRLRLFTWLCLCWLFLCGSWPVIWLSSFFFFVCLFCFDRYRLIFCAYFIYAFNIVQLRDVKNTRTYSYVSMMKMTDCLLILLNFVQI